MRELFRSVPAFPEVLPAAAAGVVLVSPRALRVGAAAVPAPVRVPGCRARVAVSAALSALHRVAAQVSRRVQVDRRQHLRRAPRHATSHTLHALHHAAGHALHAACHALHALHYAAQQVAGSVAQLASAARQRLGAGDAAQTCVRAGGFAHLVRVAPAVARDLGRLLLALRHAQLVALVPEIYYAFHLPAPRPAGSCRNLLCVSRSVCVSLSYS